MKKKRNDMAAKDHEEGQTVESYWPRGRSAATSLDPSWVSAVCSGNVTASRRDENKNVECTRSRTNPSLFRAALVLVHLYNDVNLFELTK